ncbi:MAG: hypothetical protein LBH35_09815 [Treponema sp.]|jgi:hypothetical protein|nr:hypothetical protein [Treponema sp.]
MKTRLKEFLFFAFAALAGCASPVLPSRYVLEFPPLPGAWANILGKPSWNVEWYDKNGNRESAAVDGDRDIAIPLFSEWPSPVTAWPFWPDRGMEPGMFRPAGALYPFDVSDGVIRISWRGGADTEFYRAMEEARARKEDDGTTRRAGFFDWPRFRAFFASEAPAELREDPWLTDWKEAAEKTVNSGFRTSYIKARKRTAVEVLIPHNGPWLSDSVFRGTENWIAGNIELVALPGEAEIWVCSGGMLVLSPDARLWVPARETR